VPVSRNAQASHVNGRDPVQRQKVTDLRWSPKTLSDRDPPLEPSRRAARPWRRRTTTRSGSRPAAAGGWRPSPSASYRASRLGLGARARRRRHCRGPALLAVFRSPDRNTSLTLLCSGLAVFRSPDRNTSLTEGLPRSVSGSWRPAVSPGARSGDLRTACWRPAVSRGARSGDLRTAWTVQSRGRQALAPRCVPVSRPEHILDRRSPSVGEW